MKLMLRQIYVLYFLIISLDLFHIWTIIQWYCRTYFSSGVLMARIINVPCTHIMLSHPRSFCSYVSFWLPELWSRFLHHVMLVNTDVSQEHCASIIRVRELDISFDT